MNRMTAAAAAAVLTLGSIGIAAAQDEETITIGMANLSLGAPYFIGMSQAVEAEAAYFENVDVLVTNADGDVEKLTSDVEDLIAQGVDGIVLSAAWIEAAPAAMQAINNAGIPKNGLALIEV